MVGEAQEDLDAFGINSAQYPQPGAGVPPEFQHMPTNINTMVLNDTNAQGGRAHLEPQITEQMASRTVGEAAGIVGTEAANQNEPQEEMANVT